MRLLVRTLLSPAIQVVLITHLITPGVWAQDDDELPPYENEVVIVPGDRMSQEAALRIIKGGLSASRSSHPDHADRIVCRIEATTGTRCKHLWCSTNGELDHIRSTTLGRFNSLAEAAGRGGMVTVYSGPDPAKPPCMNTAKLERALAELPAPESHFVAIQDSTLRRFADAYPRVREIQRAYARRVRRADDRQEALRLQQQADAEMTAVIGESDLDVAEYNRVTVRVARDDDLRARVADLLNDS